MKMRYVVLGLLLAGVLLMAAPAAMQGPRNSCVINPSGVGNPHVWDRSSLYFRGGCSGNCASISATVCNGADSGAMLCGTTWELYYAERGNPKRGEIVAAALIPPLEPGECFTITFDAVYPSGNYMFKAYQAEGHPGTGVLWSESFRAVCPYQAD